MIFSEALVFGLITMLGWGLGDFLMKLAVDKFGTFRTQFVQLIFGNIIGIILIYTFFPIPEFKWSLTLILLFVPFCILNIGGVLTYTEAIRRGPLSLVAPIASTYPIITAFLSVIFLKEALTLLQWFAIFIVVAGVVSLTFSSLQKKASFSGIPIAFATSLMWGVLFVLFKPLILQMGIVLPSLLTGFIGIVVIWMILIYRKEANIPKTFNRWLALVFSVVVLGIAYPIFAIGMKVSNPAIITTISSAFPAVIVLLSVIFLKEKLRRWQIIGIVTVLIGMAILGQ